MPISAVYQGHWRALELEWLRVFALEASSGSVAVTVSGSTALSRLVSLLRSPVAGSPFYPGIRHLAAGMAGVPASPPVSVPQSIALAAGCGYAPESAASAGRFFERLIENGIEAEAFQTVLFSVRGLHKEVHLTAHRYLKYCELRDNAFPGNLDANSTPRSLNTEKFQKYLFYGFYDLNPGQRDFIRNLSRTSDIIWFSPVHLAHRWRETFSRTLNFLEEHGAARCHRADADVPLSAIAQLGDNMLSGAALRKTPAVSLKHTAGGTGFTSALAGQVSAIMNRGAAPGEIAVIASGDDGRRISSALHCFGLPCAGALEVPASRLPWGRLVEALLHLPDRSFHHTDVEAMLSTGAVKGSTDGHEYFLKAAEQGARFGLEALLETGFPFARTVADYNRGIPSSDTPPGYLLGLRNAVESLCAADLPPWLFEKVLSPLLFRGSISIDFPVFRQMVDAALTQTVALTEPTPEGIRVLSIEQARGAVFPHVILTGLEEGKFPGKTVLDPRLPPKVRELLQMPSLENRENEEAFLLRQVFEASAESLTIICRSIDASGNVIPVSPFISPLAAAGSPVESESLPGTPGRTLDIPDSPPFLASSLAAQTERLTFDPGNPAAKAIHSGITGPGSYRKGSISASMLEAYASDPFRFLCERVWNLRSVSPFPVSSEPEPMSRGMIVHRSVQLVLSSKLSAREAVEEASASHRLNALVGSATLASIWKRHTVTGINRLLKELDERGLHFHDAEVGLCATIAGFPATGRVDLIFTDEGGGYVLADLKTGKPFALTEKSVLQRRFQLPFYAALAAENGISPVSGACYIFLQGDGSLTFKEADSLFLGRIARDFDERIRELVRNIDSGLFPFTDTGGGHSR